MQKHVAFKQLNRNISGVYNLITNPVNNCACETVESGNVLTINIHPDGNNITLGTTTQYALIGSLKGIKPRIDYIKYVDVGGNQMQFRVKPTGEVLLGYSVKDIPAGAFFWITETIVC